MSADRPERPDEKARREDREAAHSQWLKIISEAAGHLAADEGLYTLAPATFHTQRITRAVALDRLGITHENAEDGDGWGYAYADLGLAGEAKLEQRRVPWEKRRGIHLDFDWVVEFHGFKNGYRGIRGWKPLATLTAKELVQRLRDLHVEFVKIKDREREAKEARETQNRLANEEEARTRAALQDALGFPLDDEGVLTLRPSLDGRRVVVVDVGPRFDLDDARALREIVLRAAGKEAK